MRSPLVVACLTLFLAAEAAAAVASDWQIAWSGKQRQLNGMSYSGAERDVVIKFRGRDLTLLDSLLPGSETSSFMLGDDGHSSTMYDNREELYRELALASAAYQRKGATVIGFDAAHAPTFFVNCFRMEGSVPPIELRCAVNALR